MSKDHQGNARSWRPVPWTLLLFSLSAAAMAQGYEPSGPADSEQQDKLRPYAQIVTDLRERARRVVHTEHPVSAQHGLVRGFVHVTDGTAVLARTDLVVDAALPIIVRRGYHSSRQLSSDLGAGGWHLTLAEGIEERPSGRFVYTYGNGTTLRLDRLGGIESPLEAYLSDVTGARVLDGGRLHVSTRTGIKKLFRRSGNAYVLASVTDNHGNRLDLRYSKAGMLMRVDSSSGVWVAFNRDRHGRVESLEDSHGRVVTYGYDEAHRLATVVDTSGQPWKYSYDAANRLTSTLTPNETVDMEFSYDHAGRVVGSRANGARYTLAYRGPSTAVTDEQGLTTKYMAGASGLTVAVTNPMGTRTGLRLSKSGVPIALVRNDELVADFSDESSPNSALRARLNVDGHTYSLTYDRQHRLVQAASADGSDGFEVETYHDGVVPQSIAFADGTREEVQFDARGELARLTKRDGAVLSFRRFGSTWRVQNLAGRRADLSFDALGRLISADGDGERLTFAYNEQGLRETTESSAGWRINYRYDASGNLYYAARYNGDGSSLKSSYVMREDRRLEGIVESGGTGYQFAYGPLGELSEIRAGESVIARFEYDELVRLKRVQHRSAASPSAPSESIDYHYSPGETDIAAQLSARSLPVFSQQKEISSFPSRFDTLLTRIEPAAVGLFTYDNLRGELTLAADPSRWSPLSYVTQSIAALRLEPVLAGDRVDLGEFIIPANRLFVPPEYWTVNCCICPCPPSDPNCPPYSECEQCIPQPCQNSPPYQAPPPLQPPSAVRVPSLGTSGGLPILGMTIIETELDSFCEQICHNGEPAFRLKAQYLTDPFTYFVNVATTLPAMSHCDIGPRLEVDMVRTTNHEAVHAQKHVAVRNGFYNRFGIVYATMDACAAAREQLRVDIANATAAEKARQDAHLDHIGQTRYGAYCPTTAQQTLEAACGTVIQCNPNTY